MSPPLDVPVAFVIFNRPETAQRVFERIRGARPSRLFVVADGPRAGVESDEARTRAARRVTERIDWPCDVQRDYAPTNLGLKRRIASGLTWVFTQVDEAIVLEDDCLPDPTFFPFVAELLRRYCRDARVMTVGGAQLAPGDQAESYRFSRQPLIWGWGTWARAWQHYDGSMAAWPRLQGAGWMETHLEDRRVREYWTYLFDRHWRLGDAGSWDYAWQLACWAAGGLAIQPSCNLVTNIGFGPDGTHNRDPREPGANLPARPMTFPLRHPARIEPDAAADARLEDAMFSGRLDRLVTSLARRVRGQ
jgi:hypothetical protein